MNDLAGKTVLVTGGGSGIGLAVAKAFLERGASVAIAGRDADKLRRAAEGLGGTIHVHAADVGDHLQVRALIAAATKALGRIDILVNNAGANLKDRTFRQLTPEAWQQMIRANLDGTFYCMNAVLPQMLARKDGVIVNIGSIAGKRGNPLGGPAYVAAKFGVTGLGLCVAAEEKDSGIRVSTIFPGEVDTPILVHRPTPVSDEARAKILKPEDVAAAVLFVATLPPHVSVPELIMKPTAHVYF